MAEYYKHEIAKWNVATDDLTLEQEAAYHRVVATIRLYERPFRHNLRVLSGLWRCNERKAKRLLDELIEAGKLTIEDGFIIDEKAVDDASTLRRTRIDKQLAGHLGGIESGKSRRKSLESRDTGEAPALTREEKAREEEKRDTDVSPKVSVKGSRLKADWSLPESWCDWAREQGLTLDVIRREADRFRDYWLGVAGAKGIKLDWEATWRNWMRKRIEDAAPKDGPQSNFWTGHKVYT